MRTLRRGDNGTAVVEIRSILDGLGLLSSAQVDDRSRFDHHTELAVRSFQQSRGLSVDGQVGEETWRALDAARWRFGARTLYQALPDPLVGDDVRGLQERLLEMGFDIGRTDGVYGPRTARGVATFQREVGLVPDGACGPQTMSALKRLGPKVVGGSAQALREATKLHLSGRALMDKVIVIDPGHGSSADPGVAVRDGRLRWSEADLGYDLAARLEGRLASAGMRVHLTRGPAPAEPLPDRARAALANELGADLFISIHLDGHPNPQASGVATYHYGSASGPTSTVGERLAGLVQREIVARTRLRNCLTHAKTWELLRLTRMPAVRVEPGYLTSPADRARLVDPLFRNLVVEAIVAAVQRMYFPVEEDVTTGSIDVSALRAGLPLAEALNRTGLAGRPRPDVLLAGSTGSNPHRGGSRRARSPDGSRRGGAPGDGSLGTGADRNSRRSDG